MSHPGAKPASDPYLRAARFTGEQPAGRAYRALEQTVFTAEPNDLSVYRFRLDGVYHVAVVGMRPPPALEERLTALLRTGTPTELPATVQQALLTRRAQVTPHGPWWEAHYRPGRQL